MLISLLCFNLSECPIPPSSITHGFVHGSGSLEGDRYRSMCEPGYSLIGDDTLVCTDTGVWNGSFPTCLIGKLEELVFTSLRKLTSPELQCKLIRIID